MSGGWAEVYLPRGDDRGVLELRFHSVPTIDHLTCFFPDYRPEHQCHIFSFICDHLCSEHRALHHLASIIHVLSPFMFRASSIERHAIYCDYSCLVIIYASNVERIHSDSNLVIH